jgi:hypothetical protein
MKRIETPVIRVNTWYDTVSNESAENGDYESTGNDWRTYEFPVTPEGITEAAELFIDCAKDLYGELSYLADHCGDVLNGEPEQDYHTGFEDTCCASIDVYSDALISFNEIRDQINAEIDRQLLLEEV